MAVEALVNLELLTVLPYSILLLVDEEIEEKQKDIVGTAALYYRLDQSLKDLKVEPLFIREQWDLYSWRCRFFEEYFPDALWGVLKSRTLAFLVCCKFDQVVDLALRSDLGVRARQELFDDMFGDKSVDVENFSHSILSRRNQKFSRVASQRFDKSQVKTVFDYLYHEGSVYHGLALFRSQEDHPLSYGDVTAMVAELCPSRVKHPKKLEELAMKTVLKHGISMEGMSRNLQEKSRLLLSGKMISGNDGEDDTEKDPYVQDDYDEYNEESFDSSHQTVSDQELRRLKRIVRGKGLTIIRRARMSTINIGIDDDDDDDS